MKNKPMIYLTSILSMLILIPGAVYASDFSAMQGVVKQNNPLAGAEGKITITAVPLISSSSFTDHRDYMVYMNLPSFQSIGAGYSAIPLSNGNIQLSALTYWKDNNFVSHNYVTTLSAGQSFTAKVTQDSPNSDCWTAITFGSSFTKCFAQNASPGSNAGSTARTANDSFQSNVNDMPGFFDQLRTFYWDGSTLKSEFFSENVLLYKCNSENGYVLDQLVSFGGPNKIDQVGMGPRVFTADDCNTTNSEWDAFGD